MFGMLAARDNTIVATRARTHHLHVIDARDRTERHRVMTILADVGRRNVIRRFALRGVAVMTGSTIAENSTMVEECGGPRLRAVAVVALVVGRKVPYRLARGPPVVMATLAGTVGFKMVDSRDRNPGGRPMARIAALGSGDVGRRLNRRPDQARRAVAVPALRGCASERAVNVTGFAINVFMSAVESISRGVVIEGRRKAGLRQCKSG